MARPTGQRHEPYYGYIVSVKEQAAAAEHAQARHHLYSHAAISALTEPEGQARQSIEQH